MMLLSITTILVLFNLINITLSNILEPVVWSVYNEMFKSTNTKEEYVIEVQLGEFLNIICPKYSINDDDKRLIEYHTLYKVSKGEYDSCEIQNTIDTKQILRCDKPFDNVKYTLYISSYSPVPDAIEFIPGNDYYFISTSNTTFNGMNNTSGGTCLTNNMKIIVRVLDPNQPTVKSSTTTTKTTTKIQSTASSSSLTISNSNSIHKTKNLINTNLIYKLYTSTIKPIKTRIYSSFRNHIYNNNNRQQHKTVKHIKTTTSITTTTTTSDDLIIIQPDIEYSELLALLKEQQQQQNKQKKESTVSTSSLLGYFNNCSFIKSSYLTVLSFIIIFMIMR